MEDLIRRSDAIAILEDLQSKHLQFCLVPFRIAIEKMQAIPSADRWIPCSERLPEYRKTVLISTFWGVKTGFLDRTEAYGDFWEIIEDDATAALHSIYAWMPLPKPWKGADDE